MGLGRYVLSMRIVGVVGSLRAASFNRAVLAAAIGRMPDGAELVEVTIREVPLFDQDLEADGDPVSVAALKDAVIGADGLVLFTPEYNRSIPAVTKNAVDWLSRPPRNGPISGLPVGIVAATVGRHDASGVRDHLATTTSSAGGVVFEDTLGIGQISTLLDDDGVLVDDTTLDTLTQWLADFCDMVESTPAASAD